MGASPAGLCVLGYRVDALKVRDALTTRKTVRGCAHPEGAGKFCAECGAPMWTEEVDAPYGGYAVEERYEGSGFEVVASVNEHQGVWRSGSVFFGLSFPADGYDTKRGRESLGSNGSGYDFPPRGEIEATLGKARAALEELGLWDGQPPRLWVAHWVSW